MPDTTFKFILLKDGTVATLIKSRQLGTLVLSETEWYNLEQARDKFMEPVREARYQAASALEDAKHRERHNIREEIVTIAGCQVVVTTQGPDNEVCSMRVGPAGQAVTDEPLIRATRGFGRSGWQVEIYDKQLAEWNNRRPYKTLSNARGAAISYKSPRKAIEAGIAFLDRQKAQEASTL